MAARSLVSNPVSVIPDDEHEFEPRIEPVPKTRPIIDQAKGVLAAVRCKTPEAAFVEPRRMWRYFVEAPSTVHILRT
jgi:hypothetical protein